jgi:hypothetical protein
MNEGLISRNKYMTKNRQVGGAGKNCLFSLDTEPVFIDALRLNRLFSVCFNFTDVGLNFVRHVFKNNYCRFLSSQKAATANRV